VKWSSSSKLGEPKGKESAGFDLPLTEHECDDVGWAGNGSAKLVTVRALLVGRAKRAWECLMRLLSVSFSSFSEFLFYPEARTAVMQASGQKDRLFPNVVAWRVTMKRASRAVGKIGRCARSKYKVSKTRVVWV
jgi:hypothetical protein